MPLDSFNFCNIISAFSTIQSAIKLMYNTLCLLFVACLLLLSSQSYIINRTGSATCLSLKFYTDIFFVFDH